MEVYRFLKIKKNAIVRGLLRYYHNHYFGLFFYPARDKVCVVLCSEFDLGQ